MAETATPLSETQPYLDMIRAYDKAAAKWTTSAKKIVKRYLDERPDTQANKLKYNILWANVETLKPAIYAKTPKPEVERRFLDKDPVGRAASEVLERCLDYYISATPFGSTMRQSRTDYLLVGRGIAWVRYVPTTKPQAEANIQITEDVTEGEAQIPEQVAWEEVLSDYVHWRDFGHNVARTWEEVECVWRIVYMTREEMKARKFADWLTVSLDHVDKDNKDAPDAAKKAAVYELWDKTKRQAVWLTKSHPKLLDKCADPLGLDRFFPCSEPVYATLANESLIPVPDYIEYQDQAAELDELTARISALQKAIKAAGVYDNSQPAVGRLLNEGVQNQLIAVDSWASMAEKGGLKGAIELLPMKEIGETLSGLYDAREKVKQDLYEITGMSDIIRGSNNPNATATSENIKNNYVTMRLSEKQREMQRFARNTIEIMGNIICRHFTDDTIRMVSGVQLMSNAEKQQFMAQRQMKAQQAAFVAQQQGQQQPPLTDPIPDDVQDMLDDPSWDDVLALLRKDPDRCFRIDIETDSTIEMDASQDRDQAMQFITAIGGFIKEAQGLPPSLAPLAGAFLEFAVRKWRVGRSLENTVNKSVEMMEKQAANPPQTPPDPQMFKVQQDGQLQQAKLQSDGQIAQLKIQSDQQIAQMKMQGDQQQSEMDAQREQAMAQMKAQIDQAVEQAKLAAEDRRASNQMQFNQWKAQLDARTKVEVAEITAGATLDAAQISSAKAGAE